MLPYLCHTQEKKPPNGFWLFCIHEKSMPDVEQKKNSQLDCFFLRVGDGEARVMGPDENTDHANVDSTLS